MTRCCMTGRCWPVSADRNDVFLVYDAMTLLGRPQVRKQCLQSVECSLIRGEGFGRSLCFSCCGFRQLCAALADIGLTPCQLFVQRLCLLQGHLLRD